MLTDASLKRIARQKTESHRVAIAKRATLSSDVTEVLTDVGGYETLDTVSQNIGAKWNHKALKNLIERAGPKSEIFERVARDEDNRSPLSKAIQSSLTKELRDALAPTGINLPSEEFFRLNEEAEKKVKAEIKQDRLSNVEAMVAFTKVNSGQATLDMVVDESLLTGNFLGAVRIMGQHFSIEFQHLLNAMRQPDETPLALLSKAADLSQATYGKLETARCGYFSHEETGLDEKLTAYQHIAAEQATGLLIMIRKSISDRRC